MIDIMQERARLLEMLERREITAQQFHRRIRRALRQWQSEHPEAFGAEMAEAKQKWRQEARIR
ncbi:MAG: hypothetical protein ACRD23_06205 [Terriglobales bacterium]